MLSRIRLHLLCWFWWFSVMLHVANLLLVGPEIVVGPTDQTEYVDDRLVMPCDARGEPPPTIQWQKRNGTGGRWLQVPRMSDRHKVQRSGNLVIKRLLASDAGLYRCSAENSVATTFSAPATLVVQAKAQIVKGPQNMTVVWGTEIVLECEVVGIPFPTRSWTQDGHVVMDPATNLPSSQARLRVNATSNSIYRCHAENTHKLGYTVISMSAYVHVLRSRCDQYSGDVCQAALGSSLVQVPADIANPVSVADLRVASRLSTLTPNCVNVTMTILCRLEFPACDVTASGTITIMPLCRESCKCMVDERCVSAATEFVMPDCSMLPSINDSQSCSLVPLNFAIYDYDTVTDTTKELSILSQGVIAVLAAVGVVVVACTVAITVIIARRRHLNTKPRVRVVTNVPAPTDNLEIDVSRLPTNSAYVPPQSPSAVTDENPLLGRLEYARNGLYFCEDLRAGAFGPVFVAHAPGIGPGKSNSTSPYVVVKALRSDASDEAHRDFIRIGEILARLVHPNIVRLLGVCLSASPLCLIVEYMPGRDLSDFLRLAAPQHFIVRHVSGSSQCQLRSADLIGAARQIADAMQYVCDQGFIHRDLAARNCLVGSNTSPLEVKLADFGLTVELGGGDFHSGDDDEEMPVRWMPPEAIRENRFTRASDIWSFGVLMWEIFTYGTQPYEQMTVKEVIRFVDSGRMLHCPEHASTAVYELMRRCWHRTPSERPTFAMLHKQLSMFEDLARSDLRLS